MTDRLVFKNQLTRRAESGIRQPYRPRSTNPDFPGENEGAEYYLLRAMWSRWGSGVMVCEICHLDALWGARHDLTQADLDAHPGLLEALAWTFGFRPLELMA